MRISKWVCPPGGWKYEQDGNWIFGDSFDDLSSTLKSHRQSNKIDIGDPNQDIEDQLLRLYPSTKVDVIKIKSNGR